MKVPDLFEWVVGLPDWFLGGERGADNRALRWLLKALIIGAVFILLIIQTLYQLNFFEENN